MKLAEDGSWERIAVGRAWYLGGDKAKGQQIFDAVTSSKKAKGSDWFRVGRIYAEANEWDKAQAAFDKALALEPDDDSGMIELGALLNVNKDRAKAETLFAKAMARESRRLLALGQRRRFISRRGAAVDQAAKRDRDVTDKSLRSRGLDRRNRGVSRSLAWPCSCSCGGRGVSHVDYALIAPLARHAETHALARGSSRKACGRGGGAITKRRCGRCCHWRRMATPLRRMRSARSCSPAHQLPVTHGRRGTIPKPPRGFARPRFRDSPALRSTWDSCWRRPGAPRRGKEAARWYSCAAEQGFAAGQHHLGRHYETGDGVPRDLSKAVFWYVKAVNQNFAAAQFAFGRMRRDGIGLPRNKAEALRLFRQAAGQGFEEAQEALEEMFQENSAASKRQSLEMR